MSAQQHQQLLALAENPTTAGRLLHALEEQPRFAKALWDVYCVAMITTHFG